MNGREMAALIGKRGLLRVGPLLVPVTIKNVRQRWGRIDVLVSPVNGKGRAWRELGAAVIVSQ